MNPDQEAALNWLLSNLVTKVPNTLSALLLSADGLKKSFHGLDAEGADKLAAVASGLLSLSRSGIAAFGPRDGVRQVVVESDQVYLFVAAAGQGAVLAVVAGREANVNAIGYEMTQLINQARPHLATPARQVNGPSDAVAR